MSILDIFKSNPEVAPAQQQQQQPTPPGNIPDPNNPNSAPNNSGSVPGTENLQTPQTQQDSPLDGFAKLWETPTVDPKNSAATPQGPTALKREDLETVVSKQDFSSLIPPETLAKMAAGGEESGPAFLEAFNILGQNLMLRNVMVSDKLGISAIEKAIAASEHKIPELLREQNIRTHAVDSDPLFNNPAIKPVVEATQAALAKQYPSATPAEITQKTKEYILAMGEAFNPNANASESDASAGTDWSKYLSG